MIEYGGKKKTSQVMGTKRKVGETDGKKITIRKTLACEWTFKQTATTATTPKGNKFQFFVCPLQ